MWQRLQAEAILGLCGLAYLAFYGPGDFYDSLLSQVVRHLCGVSEIELSSCGQLWNYLHVSDAANALYCLVTQESAQGVYNVASSDTRILRSFVEEAYRVAGSEELPAFGKEMSPGVGFAPSIDKIINTTEWRPSILFEQGILGMIQAQKGKEES